MVDMAAIAGLVGSLKAAGEITKAMIGLRDAAMIQGKVIELNGVIITAQTSALEANVAQFSLLERIRELETEVARVKGWEAEKQRYQLTDFGDGTFAYLLKSEAQEGEPPHRLCANCYQRGHKSILQNMGGKYSGREMWTCKECKTEFFLGPYRPERTNPPSEPYGSWRSS